MTKYTFTYLTSGRDLLRAGVHGNVKSSAPVIFADQNSASWNPRLWWLRQVDALNRAA